MYADSSTADDIPAGLSTGVASGDAISVKQAKMVYCETCGYSLNSETQAMAHYSGKSHLRRMKQLKHGNTAALTYRPYKPKPKAVNNWSTETQTMTRWETELQQPQKTRFEMQTNFRFGSPSTFSTQSFEQQSFEQKQSVSSLGFSFNSFQSISSNGQYPQSTRFFDQSNRSASNQQAQTNVNPVAQAIMDNFLGILPTKRRKIVNCDICALTFNSDSQAEAHFQGTKHQRKVKLISGVTIPVPDKPKNMRSAEEMQSPSVSLLRCDMCHVTVNSQKQLDAHYNGMNHRNKLGLIETGKTEMEPWTEAQGHMSGWFFCATCNISVPTSVTLGQHVLSAEHMNRKQSEGL